MRLIYLFTFRSSVICSWRWYGWRNSQIR